MRSLGVNADNDLHLDPSGNLAVSVDLGAVAAACEHVMQAVLGEMVFATGRGLPFWETVWGQSPNRTAFENAARKALRGVPGVTSVPSLGAQVRDGVLTWQAVIETSFGQSAIGGQRNG